MPDNEFVTLNIVQSLLEVQANAFKASFRVVFDELKDELKSVKKDILDLQHSLSFSQGQLDTSMKRIVHVEKRLHDNDKFFRDTNDSLEAMDSELEYLENQSRRNNVRITGVPEDTQNEKTWDDTERVVKQLIKDKLGIQEELVIERCHRVKRSNKGNRPRQNGNEQPRNIVAKFASWKAKENVLRKARSIRPVGIKFVADLSQKTLAKREAQVDDLLEARRNGKLAFFVMDRLIIKDKPPDPIPGTKTTSSASSDNEVSFNIA